MKNEESRIFTRLRQKCGKRDATPFGGGGFTLPPQKGFCEAVLLAFFSDFIA